VEFHEDKLHVSTLGHSETVHDDSVVAAIECARLGDFTLGDKLDAQDAVVDSLEARDPYGNDSPTYTEAMRSPAVEEWDAAMGEERQSLQEMGVWVEDTPPDDKKKLLRTRWLLGTKRDMEGKIKGRKARIIVGGHRQVKNVNYNKTFAPTLTFVSLRMALAVVARQNWPVASFNVKTAFLHSTINEDV
jgi:hypothetical protein